MQPFKIAMLSGVATSIMLAAPASTPAFAQTALSLEEVVVTARKREESILDAPLSVSAFTEKAIVERNIVDQASLAHQTPGFDYTAPGGVSTARPVIRGMSQSSRAGDETNVATFIDGVYVDGFSSSAILLESLERVEVLRGPQSAQYGRNSFAGAINYITKKPSVKGFEAGINGVIGEDSRLGIGGYINAPVVEDKVAFRLDAAYDDTGGYYKDAVSGQHLNARESYSVRGGVLVNFSEVFSGTLQVTYQESETNTFARYHVPTDDPAMCCRSISSGAPAGFPTLYRGNMFIPNGTTYTYDPRSFAGEDEVLHVNLTLKADWDDVVLTSITGYDDRTFDTLADQDRTPEGTVFTLTPRAPGFQPRRILAQTLSGTKEKREAFSQELRLESSGENVVDWAVGAYYSKLKANNVRRQGAEIITNTPLGPNPVANTLPVIVNGVIPLAEVTDAETEMKSVFASLDYNILDNLTISGEGRYTWEDKNLDNSFLSAAPGGVGSGYEETSFKYFTPRIIITYNPNQDLTLYASAAKGTKSGGINAGVNAVVGPMNPSIDPTWGTYAPEKAWSYEIGAKFSAFENRVRGAVAAYWVDWTNQQVSNTIFVPSVNRTLTAINNAAKSRVKGVEVELAAVITEGLVTNTSYAYNDASYKDAVFSAYNVENAALYGFPGGDVSGNRIQNTSKHSFNFGVAYTLPAFADYSVTARADYIYRSKQYDTPVNLAWTPDYSTINANLTLENDNTRIGAFCTNILNDRDPSVGFNSRNINGEVVYQIQPREGRRCGLRFSLKMN